MVEHMLSMQRSQVQSLTFPAKGSQVEALDPGDLVPVNIDRKWTGSLIRCVIMFLA